MGTADFSEQIPKHVREFVARDLVLLLGGSVVVASFLYAFNHLPNGTTSKPLYAVAVGISYALGYVLQAVASALRVVTTAANVAPGRFQRRMYERFTKSVWPVGMDETHFVWSTPNPQFANEYQRAHYERVAMFLMVGATGAPSAAVSGVLIGARWVAGTPRGSMFDLALALAAFFLTLGLWFTNHINAMQIAVMPCAPRETRGSLKSDRDST